ncbi:MAG TPA: GNAT family N-acetyltransferase [Burkholderiaceae bacterium]|nr:GNAT family N-acetyltransferase [Burkholderiaceae bacterium]
MNLQSISSISIRPSQAADVAACAGVYGEAVQNGTGTFELEAPDPAEMARRRDAILAQGLPWLVAEREGEILGYAYAGPFRPRRAYRFCVEDSIYLAPAARGQGAGRLLLVELMARCEALGIRQMLAVIGDSANAASIGVHLACGFAHCGKFEAAGWKFERWLDVVMMQRRLGTGAALAPRERPDRGHVGVAAGAR